MKPGLIADIERASNHDGDGLRTVVFFKGCPLCCAWCHNPECINTEVQTLFYPEKCIHCGKCAQGCYSGARVVCGKQYTPNELLAEISQDKAYYGSSGGVTFSGGEPLMQKEFLLETLKLCKKDGINCAVETSLIYFDKEIFSTLDFVMADLKIWDSDTHRKYTGVPNDIIKQNFKELDRLGIPIIARTPVIPEIDQGIDRISAFLKELHNVKRYELLAYHALGLSKAAALGITQRHFTAPGAAYMNEVNKYAFIR